MADGQAEAHATELGSGACLTKCLKHRAQILGLDADARVHDVEAQASSAAALAHDRDDELNFALRRELTGVSEQIEQHLTDVAAVEHHQRMNAGIDPNREPQPFSLRPFLDDVAQIDGHLPDRTAWLRCPSSRLRSSRDRARR